MKGRMLEVRKTEEVRVNYEARNTVCACASNIIPKDAIQLEAHTGDAIEHHHLLAGVPAKWQIFISCRLIEPTESERENVCECRREFRRHTRVNTCPYATCRYIEMREQMTDV